VTSEEFHILIVDDNPNNVFTLRTLLNEHLPARVLEATSGQDALRLATQHQVDLILLDIQMPDMDGFETAQYLHNWSKTAHIPIVFLTAAYKSEEFRQRGFALGAADFLTKPIDAPQLISKIRTYLRLIEQERSHSRELQRKANELMELNRKLQAEIVERQQAEATREHLRRQTQLIVEAAGDGICGLDLAGHTTFINPAAAAMLGYAPEELLHQPQHELIHHHHADGTLFPLENCRIYQALRDGSARQVHDEVFWRKDGTCFPVEYMVSPIVDSGKITGVVLTFTDISARKALEKTMHEANEAALRARDAAEQANLAKSQFLANMSHELRTPLNAIIGYSEILIEELNEKPEATKRTCQSEGAVGDLHKVSGAGKHLLGLINDILDISKIEAGKMELFHETFAVGQMLDEVLWNLPPLLEKKNNRLELIRPDDLGEMCADVTKIRQILLNLLSNACKFTENGVITLELRRESTAGVEQMRFCVTDTGIGMTPAQIDKLFAAFSQADASTTRKFGGSGLGLAISKRFAEMMGGNIEVHSAPDQGSTFIVAIPTQSTVAVAPIMLPAAVQPATQKVLIIGDDSNARGMLAAYIGKQGYEPILLDSSAQAMAIAKQLKPAAITLDVMMGEAESWDLLSAFKQDEELAEIPVIVLSMNGLAAQGYALGASEYLVKPVNRDQINRVLARYCQGDNTQPVLLVEDDDTTRAMMERILKNANIPSGSAENGRLALEWLEHNTQSTGVMPSLILLDLMMPEMDGFEFLRRLQQNPLWANLPVVILTAKELTREDRERLQNGVKAVFQKGAYGQDKLLTEVRRWLPPAHI